MVAETANLVNGLADKPVDTPMARPENLPEFTGERMFRKKTVDEDFNGFLAQDTSLSGDLHFTGTLHLDGKVHGSITTTDVLIIGEHATVEAEIKAGEVQIYGTVIGNVACTRRVEICETGRLQGNLSTPNLVIKDGGSFEGTSLPVSSEGPKESAWVSKTEKTESSDVPQLTTS
jgi:cytoskeletal protein CcmA (bactofilin family)